uniref:Uncharacterized protein n=1 Tax=Romanomermis culicivorax TaxID=13658 RepID=A0A915JKC8_ROMCU
MGRTTLSNKSVNVKILLNDTWPRALLARFLGMLVTLLQATKRFFPETLSDSYTASVSLLSQFSAKFFLLCQDCGSDP